jgi:shikimate kinase
VVTRSENRDLLRQNSTVVFLDRTDIDSLAKNGRPISQAKSAQTLSEERMPMYRGWSDFTVECENPLANAKKIAEALEE